MELNKNQRLIFDLPDETPLTEIIFSILKKNNLEESEEEAVKKSVRGDDSRLIIIRDAAITVFQKRISEEKLVELLGQHLETTKETSQKVLQDIKEKLIPFVKIIDLEEQPPVKTEDLIEDEKAKQEEFKDAKEALLEKLRATVVVPEPEIKEAPDTSVKKLPTTDVEKNAQTIQQERKPILSQPNGPAKREAPKTPAPEKPADPYKEPLE